jgi:hypothetical protein
MSERARIHPLRTGAFSARPECEPLGIVVSGFFAADDKVDRGNEDHADQDVHGKRHETIPPSQATFV